MCRALSGMPSTVRQQRESALTRFLGGTDATHLSSNHHTHTQTRPLHRFVNMLQRDETKDTGALACMMGLSVHQIRQHYDA